MGAKQKDLDLGDPKDWGDLPDETQGIDKPLSAEDVLERPLVINGYVTFTSDYGPGIYAVITVNLDGELVSVSTGAKRVLEQLQAAISHFPVRAVFRKKGRSYYLDNVD